ncbi:acyl-CoA thioesterase [Rubrobacter taiwanensis]|uniref:Acyl-CoA thioesterase n=1 Tax=Rubrobacter taiwanensis TaxID=185139 RepID=A0A4R1BG71_9ACTN|nr:thioesterase family protein [Rubrobacter taiwanensis]TCJ16134.1 acyl-CoA thioesterase [Rubrobacter taiwanensis]
MAEPARFYHTLRVRYSEIDGQGIVFNSHYMTYCDVAITEYFRNLGILVVGDDAFEFALVRATLEFKRPARLDELLDVHVAVPRLGNKSFTARFEIYPHEDKRPGSPYLEAEIIYVSYCVEEGRAIPVPDRVRERIERYERTGI